MENKVVIIDVTSLVCSVGEKDKMLVSVKKAWVADIEI